MRFLAAIGGVFVVLWLVLWLGFKLVSGAVHLLLIAGLILLVWGIFATKRT